MLIKTRAGPHLRVHSRLPPFSAPFNPRRRHGPSSPGSRLWAALLRIATASMGVEQESQPHQHEVLTKTDHVDDAALAEAIAFEHSLTLKEAIKLYPAAIAWSGFVSLGVIMLAFDPQLLGNLYATPQFQSDFGYLYKDSVRMSTLVEPFSPETITDRLLHPVHHQRSLANGPQHGQPCRPGRRRTVCRLPDGHLWAQMDVFCLCSPDGLPDLYPVLCQVPRDPPRRGALGRPCTRMFRCYRSHVCLRGLPYGNPWTSHIIREPLLRHGKSPTDAHFVHVGSANAD